MSSGGSIKSEPIQPAPKKQDKEVQEANSEAIRRRQQAAGYRSTVLSRNMVSQDQLKQYFGT